MLKRQLGGFAKALDNPVEASGAYWSTALAYEHVDV
jgi:hypothetical protein